MLTTKRRSVTEWPDPFIGQFQCEQSCQPVLDYVGQVHGWKRSVVSGENLVDVEQRDSYYLAFPRQEPLPECINSLLSFAGSSLKEYLSHNSQANNFPPFEMHEGCCIIRYEPGAAYWTTHSDYSPDSPHSSVRHLGFIMYLNTVDNGGETEFVNQGIKVKPVAGRTIIFPSGWTHAHRSYPAPNEDRFIMQGWWSFEQGGTDPLLEQMRFSNWIK
jgi:hypothetical protein